MVLFKLAQVIHLLLPHTHHRRRPVLKRHAGLVARGGLILCVSVSKRERSISTANRSRNGRCYEFNGESSEFRNFSLLNAVNESKYLSCFAALMFSLTAGDAGHGHTLTVNTRRDGIRL
jgi:hypothetical protein